jgi:acetoin:2,6-dichlorophenolindophenol oxidoreductase subunit beta
MRELKYWQALSEGLIQAMERDKSVYCFGVGVDDPKGIFGTCFAAARQFGKKRVFDIPLSESALTGVAIGSSLCGMRPVMVHARNDFMLVAFDQLINNASKWRYFNGGSRPVPIVIRSIVGRGWGQGPHHSQSLQATFAHFPGLKVVMPATPYDAKGMLAASIKDDSPVVFIEHRQLYEQSGPVPEEYYEVPLGEAAIRRPGTDVTIVATSFMVSESLKAAAVLENRKISAEVIDLRTISPMDEGLIFESVRRTGRLIVADTSWHSFGTASEIVARVSENLFNSLKAPPHIIASPNVPAPVSSPLERLFYPGVDDIVKAAEAAVTGKQVKRAARKRTPLDKDFHGPF